jgi:hypothetical protein
MTDVVALVDLTSVAAAGGHTLKVIPETGSHRTHVAMVEALPGPGWVTPATFRLGASSLLQDLLGEA